MRELKSPITLRLEQIARDIQAIQDPAHSEIRSRRCRQWLIQNNGWPPISSSYDNHTDGVFGFGSRGDGK